MSQPRGGDELQSMLLLDFFFFLVCIQLSVLLQFYMYSSHCPGEWEVLKGGERRPSRDPREPAATAFFSFFVVGVPFLLVLALRYCNPDRNGKLPSYSAPALLCFLALVREERNSTCGGSA